LLLHNSLFLRHRLCADLLKNFQAESETGFSGERSDWHGLWVLISRNICPETVANLFGSPGFRGLRRPGFGERVFGANDHIFRSHTCSSEPFWTDSPSGNGQIDAIGRIEQIHRLPEWAPASLVSLLPGYEAWLDQHLCLLSFARPTGEGLCNRPGWDT